MSHNFPVVVCFYTVSVGPIIEFAERVNAGTTNFVRYSNATTLHIDIYTQTHYMYINTLRLCVHLGGYIFCIWSDRGWRDKIRSEKTTILYVAVKENKNIYK